MDSSLSSSIFGGANESLSSSIFTHSSTDNKRSSLFDSSLSSSIEEDRKKRLKSNELQLNPTVHLPSIEATTPGECINTVMSTGVGLLRSILPTSQLDKLLVESRSIETKVTAALETRKVPFLPSHSIDDGEGTETQFDEVAVRSPARLDIRNIPNIFTDNVLCPELQQVVDGLLGDDNVLTYAGLIHSLPTSTDQPWHQDGLPLFPEASLETPCYSLNVFVPLHPVTRSLGPTEFIPGSHVGETSASANEDPDKAALKSGVLAPLPTPGDILIYDYRTIHRGTQNKATETRHMLYLMFSRPWFKEHFNFGTEKLGVFD